MQGPGISLAQLQAMCLYLVYVMQNLVCLRQTDPNVYRQC